MKIGIIGCGFRAKLLLQTFHKLEAPFDKLMIFDLDKQGAIARAQEAGYPPEAVAYWDDLHRMLDEGKPDGVMVATNCNTHSEFASEVMKRNLPMFLEKPVAVSKPQLENLALNAQRYSAQAVVSFPLRGTPLCKKAKAIIDSGLLGEVTHVQAVNNVPYGGVYFHDWYRDEDITGGLFLQKATHDIDYILHLLGKRPVELAAMESKNVFRGERPSGLKCRQCPEYHTCDESSFVREKIYGLAVKGEYCSFAEDTGNHDSATLLLRMEDGMHVTYSQNFYARRGAGRRGARFIGYHGTLEMDFPSGSLTVYGHHLPEKQVYTVDQTGMKHFGGDLYLAQEFLKILRDPQAVSDVALQDGINSAAVCLAAARSAKEGTFIPVEIPGGRPV